MKKLLAQLTGVVSGLILVGLLIILTVMLVKQETFSTLGSFQSPIKVPTSKIPPTPVTDEKSYTSDNTPTPPLNSKPEKTPQSELKPTPTATALPIIDLAKGYEDGEKMIYIIKREDGSMEEYIIPISSIKEKENLMKLDSKDMIVGSQPLVPLPQSTPNIKKSATAESIFISPVLEK